MHYKITTVHDVTSFGVQIIEHVDENGCKRKIENLRDSINKILGMKLQKNRVYVQNVQIGKMVAYEKEPGIFFRCQVIEVLKEDFETKQASVVKIKYLETGESNKVQISELYEIEDQSIKKIPPQSKYFIYKLK